MLRPCHAGSRPALVAQRPRLLAPMFKMPRRCTRHTDGALGMPWSASSAEAASVGGAAPGTDRPCTRPSKVMVGPAAPSSVGSGTAWLATVADRRNTFRVLHHTIGHRYCQVHSVSVWMKTSKRTLYTLAVTETGAVQGHVKEVLPR